MSACSTLNTTDLIKGSQGRPFLMTQGIRFRLKNRVFKSPADGGGPFDLTGFTGRSQMRVDPSDQGPPIATFTVTVLVPGTNGVADVVLDPSDNANIETGIYVFDIEYIDGLDPENIISGTSGRFLYIQVLPGVTKP